MPGGIRTESTGGVKSQIDRLNTQTTNQSSTLEKHQELISELTSRIATIEGGVSTIQDGVKNLEDYVNG